MASKYFFSFDSLLNPEKFNEHVSDKYYTYAHYKKDGDLEKPFYIGKGKNRRCFSITRTKFWTYVANKHGVLIKLLDVNLTQIEALEREAEYIEHYGLISEGGCLVNVLKHGSPTYEEVQKIKKRKALDQTIGDRKKYFGKKLYGEDNPNFGNKGIKNPLSIPVVKLDLDGNFIEQYASAVEAEEKNQVRGIIAVCRGKRNQLHGYKYVYLSDYESGNYEIKLGITNRKAVYGIDPETLEIKYSFNCVNEIDPTKFCPTKIGAAARGARKSSGGLLWCFQCDYEEKIEEYRRLKEQNGKIKVKTQKRIKKKSNDS